MFPVIYVTTAVVFSSLCSALTVSLARLEEDKIYAIAGDEIHRHCQLAKAVVPIMEKGYWALYALALLEVFADEALPVILQYNAASKGTRPVLVSTVLVIIFGEFIPGALGYKYPLLIMARFSKPVKALMLLTSPVSYPFARLTETLIGKEPRNMSRATLHYITTPKSGTPKRTQSYSGRLLESRANASSYDSLKSISTHNGALHPEELLILRAAPRIRETKIADIETPLQNALCVFANGVIDSASIRLLRANMHKFVPVNDGNSGFKRVISTKDLIGCHKNKKVSEMPSYPLREISGEKSILDLLAFFRKSQCKIALVTSKNGPTGIVTLKDAVMEVLGKDLILDEIDASRETRSRGDRASRINSSTL